MSSVNNGNFLGKMAEILKKDGVDKQGIEGENAYDEFSQLVAEFNKDAKNIDTRHAFNVLQEEFGQDGVITVEELGGVFTTAESFKSGPQSVFDAKAKQTLADPTMPTPDNSGEYKKGDLKKYLDGGIQDDGKHSAKRLDDLLAKLDIKPTPEQRAALGKLNLDDLVDVLNNKGYTGNGTDGGITKGDMELGIGSFKDGKFSGSPWQNIDASKLPQKKDGDGNGTTGYNAQELKKFLEGNRAEGKVDVAALKTLLTANGLDVAQYQKQIDAMGNMSSNAAMQVLNKFTNAKDVTDIETADMKAGLDSFDPATGKFTPTIGEYQIEYGEVSFAALKEYLKDDKDQKLLKAMLKKSGINVTDAQLAKLKTLTTDQLITFLNGGKPEDDERVTKSDVQDAFKNIDTLVADVKTPKPVATGAYRPNELKAFLEGDKKEGEIDINNLKKILTDSGVDLAKNEKEITALGKLPVKNVISILNNYGDSKLAGISKQDIANGLKSFDATTSKFTQKTPSLKIGDTDTSFDTVRNYLEGFKDGDKDAKNDTFVKLRLDKFLKDNGINAESLGKTEPEMKKIKEALSKMSLDQLMSVLNNNGKIGGATDGGITMGDIIKGLKSFDGKTFPGENYTTTFPTTSSPTTPPAQSR